MRSFQDSLACTHRFSHGKVIAMLCSCSERLYLYSSTACSSKYQYYVYIHGLQKYHSIPWHRSVPWHFRPRIVRHSFTYSHLFPCTAIRATPLRFAFCALSTHNRRNPVGMADGMQDTVSPCPRLTSYDLNGVLSNIFRVTHPKSAHLHRRLAAISGEDVIVSKLAFVALSYSVFQRDFYKVSSETFCCPVVPIIEDILFALCLVNVQNIWLGPSVKTKPVKGSLERGLRCSDISNSATPASNAASKSTESPPDLVPSNAEPRYL